jgi:hypothetical protein
VYPSNLVKQLNKFVLCQIYKESAGTHKFVALGLKVYTKEPPACRLRVCEKVSDNIIGKVVMQSQNIKHF